MSYYPLKHCNVKRFSVIDDLFQKEVERAAIVSHLQRNSVALDVAEIVARISSSYLAAAGYLTMRVIR